MYQTTGKLITVPRRLTRPWETYLQDSDGEFPHRRFAPIEPREAPRSLRRGFFLSGHHARGDQPHRHWV
jgi:hypothetical protein